MKSLRAVSSFEVTGWDQAPYGESVEPPLLSQATVKKKFTGELEGESTAQLLMCQADAKDLSAGAGYVASEVVEGVLNGKAGTFVMQHGGLSGGGKNRTYGHIVPGSGTGELKGITGETTIASDGEHTIEIEYRFD